MSQEILGLDKDLGQLGEILSEDSISNLKVYKKNYMNHVFNILSGDFPALKKYLGENNFYFFARKYLIEVGIQSPSIAELSRAFKVYLVGLHSLHEDDLIEDIVKIDLLWSQSYPQEIEVSSGALEFWQELISGDKSEKVINLDVLVRIVLINYKGEQAFKVLT